MDLFNGLRHWWRAVTNRRALETELDEEIEFHVEHQIERHRARVLSLAEAEAAARRDLGSVASLKDDVRDTWHPARVVDELHQDLAYAWRGITRNRLFAGP